MIKKVILISGKAGAGKDTLGDLIKHDLETAGYRVLLTHYADLLKHICAKFFDWDGQKNEAGRTLLQYVGTDVIRRRRPSFWVDFIVDILNLFDDKWDYVVIPDCRFPNEISVLKNEGFDVVHIHVTRDSASNLNASQQQHASETSLDNEQPDYVVHNDGTIADLHSSYTLVFDNDPGVIRL